MTTYKTPATGSLGLPTAGHGENLTAEAIEQIEGLEDDDLLLTTRDGDSLDIDEMYFSDGSLGFTALFDDWYISMDIPIRPNRAFRELLRDMNEAFDVTARESGYYLSNDDVAFVDTFTPDSQGRITLGRGYADKDVKVIAVVEDE